MEIGSHRRLYQYNNEYEYVYECKNDPIGNCSSPHASISLNFHPTGTVIFKTVLIVICIIHKPFN